MTARGVPEPLEPIDRRITGALAQIGVPFVRIALGVVFLWFGVLKLFPNLSPAELLAGRTIEVLSFGLVKPAVPLPVLAVWESLIGLGLIFGRGAARRAVSARGPDGRDPDAARALPERDVPVFPLAPTLEGQYIIKNFVLIGAAMVVGATVRGGRIEPEPDRPAG